MPQNHKSIDLKKHATLSAHVCPILSSDLKIKEKHTKGKKKKDAHDLKIIMKERLMQ